MPFLKKSSLLPGWLGITFEEGGVRASHVRRPADGRPVVESTVFLPGVAGSEVETLERLGKELHADRYACTTLLPDGTYQLVSVEQPNVPSDELKIAIRWRLKDLLDFHVDDATIDVLSIPTDKNASSRNQSIYAVAARNSVIQQRQAHFEQARVPLRVIDIPELAQRNLSALVEPPGRGIAMLSFGREGGLLTVTFGGELCLSRRIDIAFSQLQTGADQRTALLDRITLELQRSLDHVDRQFHFITLAKLLIAPVEDDTVGLREYLGANLYLPVESFTLDSVLDLSRTPELLGAAAQQRFFLTVGAALRHEEKVL